MKIFLWVKFTFIFNIYKRKKIIIKINILTRFNDKFIIFH